MRFYSSTAIPMTLNGGVNSTDTTMTLSTVVGLPSSLPFTLLVDPDGAGEEIVTVTAISGPIVTVARGQDGSTAIAHIAGVNVWHGFSARDFQEPQVHIAGLTSVHGVTGNVVGTVDTQTLSNKTLTAPTINAGFVQDTVHRPSAVSLPALVVQGLASQAGPSMQVKLANNNIIFQIDKDGRITPSLIGNVPLSVKGFAGQTAALQQWLTSADVAVAQIAADGGLVAGAAQLTTPVAGTVPLIVKGALTQSADLVQVKDSTGAVLVNVTSGGAMRQRSGQKVLDEATIKSFAAFVTTDVNGLYGIAHGLAATPLGAVVSTNDFAQANPVLATVHSIDGSAVYIRVVRWNGAAWAVWAGSVALYVLIFTAPV